MVRRKLLAHLRTVYPALLLHIQASPTGYLQALAC